MGEDQNTLWAMNMYSRTLVRIDVTGGVAPGAGGVRSVGAAAHSTRRIETRVAGVGNVPWRA